MRSAEKRVWKMITGVVSVLSAPSHEAHWMSASLHAHTSPVDAADAATRCRRPATTPAAGRATGSRDPGIKWLRLVGSSKPSNRKKGVCVCARARESTTIYHAEILATENTQDAALEYKKCDLNPQCTAKFTILLPLTA